MTRLLSLLAACIFSASIIPLVAEATSPELKGIACRSVHLSYTEVPEAAVFYNEITVEKSSVGTYFCVCGFSRGYYGIQELADGKKVLLFSVWDPGDQNDPNDVDEEQRVKLLYQHPEVRVQRFGNEGTGGQSFLDFGWSLGKTYRFAVAARRVESRTEFAAYFFHPTDNAWRHLVTFSTLTKETQLKGFYGFIEDFRRNRISAKKTRKAAFPNPWVMLPDRNWKAIEAARFTADENPVTNIDSGLEKNQFWIATGGDLINENNALNEVLRRQPEVNSASRPDDLTSVVAKWLDSGKPVE